MTPSLSETARPIFLHWERLRIPYNLTLGVMTVLFHPGLFNPGDHLALVLVMLGIGCVGANLCFLAAPIFETYVAWLGVRSQWLTIALFCGGVLISIPLVIAFPVLW